MTRVFRSQFCATLHDLPQILHWVRDALSQANMDPSSMRKLMFAVEEAIVNIVHHAYRGRGGKLSLAVKVLVKGVEVQVVDEGPPFDPTKEGPFADRSSPLEKRKEGGLGLLLMRESVDLIDYERDAESNRLTLFKRGRDAS